MEEQGWIKLHRKLITWEWSDDPQMFSLFIHLIMMANHKDKKWHGKLVKRGQLITGRKSLAKKTGLSIQSLRTRLSHLQLTGEILIKPTSKYSIITIVNYGQYQLTDREPTINQPSTNHQPTTNNNDNNDNNIYNSNNTDKSGKQINDILNTFIKINPTINFANKTQRSAADYLINKFSYKTVIDIAKYAISIQSQDYAPTITNPYELKEKWGKLRLFFEKSKKPKKLDNEVRVMKDGTKVIKKFNTWVSANDNTVKIDLSYYPELRNL